MQEADLSRIEKKLISYKRMLEIYDNNEKPVPYAIERSTVDQKVIFIGCQHTNDISSPQFTKLKEYWRKFVRETKDPRILLVEGGASSPHESEEKAISVSGEKGLVTYLAHQEDIEVASPEPPRKAEADKLANEFGRDSVMLYYFLRQIPQYHRMRSKREPIKKYMQKTLDSYSKRLEWVGFDFSYQHLVDIYQATFSANFDPNDRNRAHMLSDPTLDETVVNKVSRSSGRYRDAYIAVEIIKYWNEGKSIFAVFGSAHAYSLEPILEELK